MTAEHCWLIHAVSHCTPQILPLMLPPSTLFKPVNLTSAWALVCAHGFTTCFFQGISPVCGACFGLAPALANATCTSGTWSLYFFMQVTNGDIQLPQALGNTPLQSLLLYSKQPLNLFLHTFLLFHPTELLTLVGILFSTDQHKNRMWHLAKGHLKS